MGLASPSPSLPEEGGPPGGVISGRLYVDEDGSRSLTSQDGPAAGGVSIDQIDDAGNAIVGEGVEADANGFWQRRALPDGRYRVSWEPPIAPELYSQTIPPAETIVVNPNLTIQRVVSIVEITNANRVTDVNFGMPAPTPSTGGIAAPDTGRGTSGTGNASFAALGIALALAIFGAGILTVRRRRA
jgi:hypothetical protein